MKLLNVGLVLAGTALAEDTVFDSTKLADQQWLTHLVAESCEETPVDADERSGPQGWNICQKLVKAMAEVETETYVAEKTAEAEQKASVDGRMLNGDMTAEEREHLLETVESSPLLTLRKLKQLKVLILWLQPEHRFARYCFYGCWCLPDNDHKLYTVGYGKPVDNVDASCKRQSQCYDCAQIDHEDRVCDANSMGYSYKLHMDSDDPTNNWKKSIECTDNPDKGGKGSCRRSICECDKKLAEDLREYFSEWNIKNHQEQGAFDSATKCVVEGCKNGNCGGNEVECCGNLGSGPRMPYKTDGRRMCCGDKTYDSSFQECCEDFTLAALGTC